MSPSGSQDAMHPRDLGGAHEKKAASTVAVFARSFPPAFLGGGPIRTLDALVSEAPPNEDLLVITSNRDLGARETLPVVSNAWVKHGRASVNYMSANRLRLVLAAFVSLRNQVPTTLYFNSFFDFLFSIFPQLLYRISFFRGHPVRLLAPRGEFGPGALDIKSAKKRAFISIYRLLSLHRDIVWHASSEAEAMDIRNTWGTEARILVREDETSLPLSADPPIQSKSTELAGVFLGRIVPVKGLLELLTALANCTSYISLDIFGSEEDSRYAEQCHRAASKVPSNISVAFRGPIPPEHVRSTLGAYDVLLMPTSGENFGHVIAEALSVSCPVICTDRTPWTSLLSGGAGQVVASLATEDWRRAIESYASLGSEDKLANRINAGLQYEKWRAHTKGPHVLALLDELVESQQTKQSITRAARA